jgi:hypothetical protein
MSATDKALKTTTAPLPANEAPVPQYYSPTNDRYEEHQGEGGAAKVRVEDGHDVATGAKADAAATTDTGTFSLIALFKRGLSQFATLLGVVGTAGSAAPSRSVLIGGTDGTNLNVLRTIGGVGDGQGSNVLAVGQTAFNGNNWDRWRNNTEGTLLASAARTTTTNSSVVTNYNAKGAWVFIDVTANPGGAETLTIKLRLRDPVTGKMVPHPIQLAVPAATNGTYALHFMPGASGNGSQVTSASAGLPRQWDVQVVHSAAGSWTYSVGYSLIV